MTYSEAILLGSALAPQTFHRLRTVDVHTGQVLATCAMGAAIEAGFHTHAQAEPYTTTPAACPICQQVLNVWAVVVCLNDRHKWTRPRIAAWVAEQEARMPSLALDTEAAAV